MAKTIGELSLIIENHIANEQERHDVFDEKLDKIDSRLIYTNGNIKDLIIWRAYMLGGMVVITSIVIPLLVYVWNNK